MAKSKTPSFVVEIPLVTNSEEAHILQSRFEAGRQIYSACLGEAIKRRDMMLKSKIYRKAQAIPKTSAEDIKWRSEVFKEARHKYVFSEYALHEHVKGIRNSWLGKHIDSLTAQKLATRAYSAVDKTFTGTAQRVVFKRYGELHSLEGKNNSSGIRWRDNQIVWSGLRLQSIIDTGDKVIMHGLSCPVKYVRILKKAIRGKTRYYAQLICEGVPHQKEKNTTGTGTVGLDIGPSTIAEVGDTEAHLNTFCRELDNIQTGIRVLQRKLDRQRRANNPDNYNPDSTIKRKRKKWVFSQRYKQARAKLTEISRRQAEYRKSLHGKLANDIVRKGAVIYTEDISYRSLQRNYGKSVNYRAPGMFVAGLRRKAVVIEFPTKTTALSQICHCGRKYIKKLNARWHRCSCGVTAQRDLYSAFLARHVVPDGEGVFRLNCESATKEWPYIKPLLDSTLNEVKLNYWHKAPASFGI